MKVRCQAGSDIGLKREVNQDSYRIGDDPSQSKRSGHLLVVCDGMGGHEAGEVASRIGAETILDEYYHSEHEDRRVALEHAFHEANRRIHEQVQGHGNMGTTGVAALLFKNHLYIANVGDSRAYLIRNGEIRPISRDHSLVAEQVAAGILTPEQARHSHYRNMITRALGYRPEVQVDFPFASPVQPGNIVVLSSDGLHGLVEDDEIAQMVTRYSPDEAIRQLIATANDRGGTDNITVAVAVVDELDQDISPTPGGGAPQGSASETGVSSEADDDAPTSRIAVPRSRDSQTVPLDHHQDAPTARPAPPTASTASTASTTRPMSAATRPLSPAEIEESMEEGRGKHPPKPDRSPPKSPPPLLMVGGVVIAVVLVIVGFMVFRASDEEARNATPLPTTEKPSPNATGSPDPPSATAVGEEESTPAPSVVITATRTTTTTVEEGGPTVSPTSELSRTRQTRPNDP